MVEEESDGTGEQTEPGFRCGNFHLIWKYSCREFFCYGYEIGNPSQYQVHNLNGNWTKNIGADFYFTKRTGRLGCLITVSCTSSTK